MLRETFHLYKFQELSQLTILCFITQLSFRIVKQSKNREQLTTSTVVSTVATAILFIYANYPFDP